MATLNGKVAIVTGASSGIGRAIAIRLAAEGASVVIADVKDRPVEGGIPTTEVINAAGHRCHFVETDVSDANAVENTVREAVDRYGRLDVMVNNAAIYTSTGLIETTTADWKRVMAVNVEGVFLGCKSAVRQFLTQEPVGEARGRIINIASQHGMISCPGDVAYGVSKAAVEHLTRQVATEFAEQLIPCNAIAPGKILTGRTDIGIDPVLLAYARSRTPWPRLGRPEDIAGATLFLASDMASYITGATLLVDGGWMAR